VGEWVKDVGASECRSVMGRIGVQALPCLERGLTSDGSWITRKVRKGSTREVTWTMIAIGVIEGPQGAAAFWSGSIGPGYVATSADYKPVS
jgi:hypothetical protein